jgi:hypothetical protein
MAKARKFLRKQADKAERAARVSGDTERAEGLLAMWARAYRAQADVIRSKKKKRQKARI